MVNRAGALQRIYLLGTAYRGIQHRILSHQYSSRHVKDVFFFSFFTKRRSDSGCLRDKFYEVQYVGEEEDGLIYSSMG